jgi:hypothetical protein
MVETSGVINTFHGLVEGRRPALAWRAPATVARGHSQEGRVAWQRSITAWVAA